MHFSSPLAGKSPHQAVRNFIEPLNRAISCVTQAVVSISPDGYNPDKTQPHVLVLNKGNPVKLRGNSSLYLTVIIHYRITTAEGELGPWKVSISAYYYEIQDGEQHTLVAYHWHPNTKPSTPHLHLGTASGVKKILGKAHFPTQRICLEEVLRFAMIELKVKPRKKDWQGVLEKTQMAYEKYRTWS